MLTTLSTSLVPTLIAVSFGWVPVEEAPASSDGADAATASPATEQDGYKYIVQLSPADLAALSSGKTPHLRSELPADIGPIKRVEVYVGVDEPPRRLSARDAASPRRMMAGSTAQRRTVAKPVVPDWPDAAAASADAAAPATEGPEERTAYQNPDPLNLRGLQRGVEDATRPLTDAGREVSQWAGDQTRRLGDNLRRGAENTLRGTGEALENLATGGANRTAPAYGNRPNPGYANNPQVAPPQPSAGTAPPYNTTAQANGSGQYNNGGQFGSAPQYNGTSPSYGSGTAQATNDPLQRGAVDNRGFAGDFAQNPNLRGPALPPDPNTGYRQDQSGIRGDGLATNFSDDDEPFVAQNRRMEPVRRSYDPTLDSRRTAQQDWNSGFNTSSGESNDFANDGFASDPGGFPDMQPANGSANSDWYNNQTTRGQSPGADFANTTPPPAYGGADTGGFASDNTRPANATAWGDNPAATTGGVQQAGYNGQAAPPGDRSGEFWSSALLVILGAATAFTWIAYLDVRNKYRSVLRNMPGSGYSAAA